MFNMLGMGSLTGTVTDSDTGEPLEGVKVQLDGTQLYYITNAEGEYNFRYLTPGTYSFTATLFGYYDGIATGVVINEDAETTRDFELVELPKVKVFGIVTASDDSGVLEDVEITLTGYDNYGPIFTDVDGYYEIEDVYAAQTYSMQAKLSGWQTYNHELVVGDDDLEHNFIINEIPFPVPNTVTATSVGDNVLIEWEVPVPTVGVSVTVEADDVWEDGTGYQLLLDETATEYGVTIPTTGPLTEDCSMPATFYDVFSHKIPTTANPSCSPPAANWVVSGSATIEIPPGVYDWCITNPEPGNLIWIASNGGRADDYEFEEGKNYHLLMHRLGNNDAVTITVTDAKSAAPTRAFENYSVYRLPFNAQDNETLWTTLAANTAALEITDNTFSSAPSGIYRWAVKANYTNGVQSVPRFSNALPTADMYVPVTFNITTNDAQPPTGAHIIMTALAQTPWGETPEYEGTATASGLQFPQVLKGSYKIVATKEGYISQTIAEIEIDGATTVPIMFTEGIYKPSNVVATPVDGNMVITWETPVPFTPVTFRYDSGTAGGQLGFTNGTVNGLIGSLHLGAATLETIHWVSTDNAPQTQYDLWILGLDATGMPDRNQLLYRAQNVPNVQIPGIVQDDGDQPNPNPTWNTYQIPEPFDVNGFFVAASPSNGGFLSIAVDVPNAQWPFAPDAHYYSSAPTSAFTEFGGAGFPLNVMIRVDGTLEGKSVSFGYPMASRSAKNLDLTEGPVPDFIPLATPVVVGDPIATVKERDAKVLMHYNVYSLKEDELTVPALWEDVELNVTGFTATDTEWSNVETGGYYYAVTAIYTGPIESEPAFSEVVYTPDMTSFVTLTVTTNSDDPVNGTEIVLTQENGDHIYEVTANGPTVIIPAVWKGTYTITATLAGFEPFTKTGVIIMTDEFEDAIELIEIITDPFGLEIHLTGDCGAVFSWGHSYQDDIFDDFESYAPFLITTQIGPWKNINVNTAATWSHTSGTWPNQEEPKAFFVMNSSQTVPSTAGHEHFAQRPGSMQMLGAFSKQSGVSDDWLISPALDFRENFVVKFWARALDPNSQYGAESFRVAYSTTGDNVADFTNIIGDVPDVPGVWTEYSYTIPPTANHIAINHYSEDSWALWIDDLYVGLPDKGRAFEGYAVYLNDDYQGFTTSETWTFTNLNTGTYVASLERIYTSGPSNRVDSEPFEIECDDEFPTVTFVVTNKNNGAPILDANIVFDGKIGYVHRIAIGGPYSYEVSKDGYISQSADDVMVSEDMIITIELEPEIGIRGTSLTNVVLYPNPFSNEISISHPELIKSVQITNAFGQKIKETIFVGKTINTGDLATGVYIVTIESVTGEKAMYKMIKK